MQHFFLKTLALLTVCAALPLSGATYKLLDLTKGNFQDGKVPPRWVSYKAATYLPLPQLSYKMEEGKRTWNISKVAGKDGARFDSYYRYPAKAGDKFVVTVEARGKGKISFIVQALSAKKWEGHIGIKSVAVNAKYGVYKISFDVKNMKNPTEKLYCHFMVDKGSDISIRSIAAEVIPGKAGK